VAKPRTKAWSDKTQDFTFYEHERIGAEMVRPILTRLRFSNEERERIAHLVRHHLVCYDDGWTDAAVRRWIRRVTRERVEDLYALHRADTIGKGHDPTDELDRLRRLEARVAGVIAAGDALSVRDLAVSGKDLMGELGMKPGRAIGEVLEHLLELVVDDPSKNDRAVLLDAARARIAAG
jgi:tRNA nucleotidyltransferase (CCA-adding enzyme)